MHTFIQCSHLGAKEHPLGGLIKSTGLPSIGINLSWISLFILGIDFNYP